LTDAVCVLALGSGCGTEAAPDVASFLGSFRYESGEVRAVCQGVTLSESISGTLVEVVRGDATDLELLAGPRCEIALNIEGGAASATPNQGCEISVKQSAIAANFAVFRLERSASVLSSHATGTASVLVPIDDTSPDPAPGAAFECETFDLTGALAPSAN
jgi:hypothetical protein